VNLSCGTEIGRERTLLRRGRVLEGITLGWNVAGIVVLAVAAGKARTGKALANPVLTTEGRVTLVDGIGDIPGLTPRVHPSARRCLTSAVT
jgi:hypothetical protein